MANWRLKVGAFGILNLETKLGGNVNSKTHFLGSNYIV
jgi:hypothetical protein